MEGIVTPLRGACNALPIASIARLAAFPMLRAAGARDGDGCLGAGRAAASAGTGGVAGRACGVLCAVRRSAPSSVGEFALEIACEAATSG